MDVEKMVALYNRNYSLREIAPRVHYSPERVRQLIAGRVQPRPHLRNWYGDANQVIRALGTDSDARVARRFGLSTKSVTELRVRRGIKARYARSEPDD